MTRKILSHCFFLLYFLTGFQLLDALCRSGECSRKSTFGLQCSWMSRYIQYHCSGQLTCNLFSNAMISDTFVRLQNTRNPETESMEGLESCIEVPMGGKG
ncbi:hypothetical protein B0T09DRAFT_98612 [Sordaria sp. MPI-SDFR-AT-0083]|nr:hypothetical protein B0T09DRAFT_98612 [Sordaria sp. MPI-SDFR-AT-0083]